MKTLKGLYIAFVALVLFGQFMSDNADKGLIAWAIFGIYAAMALVDETVDWFGQLLAAAVLFIPIGVYVL